MKFFFFFLLLIVSTISFSISVNYLPVPSNDLVKHTYYVLSYNEKYEQANWVYYMLTDSMVIKGGQERSNKFKVDMMVPSGSAKSSDYTKSGYDRGHLCPAADMDFNAVAMQESFMMSNISPQSPDFNRGVWKDLETEVRKWAVKDHKLYIVTGPVFKDNKGTIGEDKVLVPGSFFKIIYQETGQAKMIAFLLPNRKSDRPFTDFAVTIDEIEKLTGFDFFSQLPDELENKLEGHVDLSGWVDGYKNPEPIVAQVAQQKEQSSKSDMNFYLILGSVVVLISVITVLKGLKNK